MAGSSTHKNSIVGVWLNLFDLYKPNDIKEYCNNVYLCLSLPVSACAPLCLYLYLCYCLYICPCLCLCFCFCLYLSMSPCLFPCVCLCVCVCVSVSACQWCPSLSPCVCLCVCLYRLTICQLGICWLVPRVCVGPPLVTLSAYCV